MPDSPSDTGLGKRVAPPARKANTRVACPFFTIGNIVREMCMPKSSFVLYLDYRKHLDLIQDDSDFRRLIEAIFAYCEDGEEPSNLSPIATMAFSFIRANLDRDNIKYESVKEKRKESGRLGGIARASKAKQNVANEANASKAKQNVANEAVNATATATATATVKCNTPYTPQSGELSLIDFSSASPSVCDSSPIGEKKVSSKENAAGYSEDFERFWKAYPKRVSKGQAWKTWEKLRKAKELPDVEELCKALSWRRIADDWEKDDGRYIPHPSTWLNAHGWEDEACKEPPDDPRNDPREGEAYRIANSMGGFMPLREECRNTRLYWERMVRINEALEDAGYGEFGTNKELIAMNLGENK